MQTIAMISCKEGWISFNLAVQHWARRFERFSNCMMYLCDKFESCSCLLNGRSMRTKHGIVHRKVQKQVRGLRQHS